MPKYLVNMNKGVSLYLAVVIMAILLAIVLGVSAILVSQIKITRGLENSVIAFYAADTGIEWILKYREDPINNRPPNTCTKTNRCQLGNEAEYYVEVRGIGNGCNSNFCIKSFGNYKGTNRAIEVEY